MAWLVQLATVRSLPQATMQIAAADRTLTALAAPLGERSSPAAEAAAPVAPVVPAQEQLAAQTSDRVTLSAASQSSLLSPPAPVYAEIWRDGHKVAQVDIHGTVSGLAGQVAGGGGSLAGPLLAAQRAVQVAWQTGGEIRVAGQALDGQTLMMRARLAKTYVF